MEKLFYLVAALYAFCTLGRIFLWDRESSWEKSLAYLEKASFLLFTLGIVFYIRKLEIVDNTLKLEHYYHPLSWLLFAWSLQGANLVAELAYGSNLTNIFANTWVALALGLAPQASDTRFAAIFTNDVLWLSFHRLCFLLGYAFCILAFPLALLYLWKKFRFHTLSPEKQTLTERSLWKIDRLSYRMILWALPLLTLGFLLEALALVDRGLLPEPIQVWTERKETFLALATWFTCGIYLHSRLFFGWKNQRIAFLYLVGLLIIVSGHYSTKFLSFTS